MYRGVRVLGDEHVEWKEFSSFIVSFWHAQLTQQDVTPQKNEHTPSHFGEDPWQVLMALDEPQSMLQTRQYPAFLALAGSVHGGHHSDRKMEDFPEKVVLQGDRRNMAADSLAALHSIFEDLMLDMTMWRHLPGMAALLACLSRMLSEAQWEVRPFMQLGIPVRKNNPTACLSL